MGFFKSLKGNHPDKIGQSSTNSEHIAQLGETYAPPSYPLPNRQISQPKPQCPPPGMARFDHEPYCAPPGLPPGHQNFQPPAGPPTSHNLTNPPQWRSSPGSAQNQPSSEPPSYHDWTVIPDTALLPPPPSLGHHSSPSGNAELSDADRAHEWCNSHPMVRPHQPTSAQHNAVAMGDVQLIKPLEYRSDLLMPSPGLWSASTRSGSKDSCLVSSLPLYFAEADVPTETMKTIYYELKIRSLGRGRGTDDSAIAVGYCAMPYPTWRMPGWERGSLAVHGDDGRRYVNNTWGGKDFTSPFKAGDTVGIGMTFSAPTKPPEYGALQHNSIEVEVFLTRNGEKAESWTLHEETDANEHLDVDGLDGRFDLYAAIGTFGGVEFDVLFSRQYWLWRPR